MPSLLNGLLVCLVVAQVGAGCGGPDGAALEDENTPGATLSVDDSETADLETQKQGLWASWSSFPISNGQTYYTYASMTNTGFGQNHYIEWASDWNQYYGGTLKICRQTGGSWGDCTGEYNVMSRIYSVQLPGQGVQSYRFEWKGAANTNFHYRTED